MRVTDSILQQNFLSNLSYTTERLYESETRVLTNKRLNKPSDNPVDALNAMMIRTKLDEIDQYKRNISRASTLLSNTETVITEVGDTFQRVMTLAVQGASDSYSVEDKVSISYEVNQLIEQLFNASNNRSGGTFTFAGTNSDTAPYLATRNEAGQITAVTTSGSGGNINCVIGENITIKSNVNGQELFEGGQNLFDVLISIRDNLEAGDSDALQQNLEQVNEAVDQISNVRSVVGSRVNRVTAAETRASNDFINFTAFLSNTEDVDASEAILDYQTKLVTLQASLQVGARLMYPKLGDYLK